MQEETQFNSHGLEGSLDALYEKRYFHRVFAGPTVNSVRSCNDLHFLTIYRNYVAEVFRMWLREDLQPGKQGSGVLQGYCRERF